jgi:hypothetical protein
MLASCVGGRLAFGLVLALSIAGCGGKEKEDAAPASTAAKSAQPAAAATPPPAATPAPSAEASAKPSSGGKVELEDVPNNEMHYTIKIPKGGTTTLNNKMGGMYGFETLIIKVDPSGVALKTPDDLLRGVNTHGGDVDKKTDGDTLVVVVTAKDSPVAIYAGPKGAKVIATCLVEPKDKELGLQVCKSLQTSDAGKDGSKGGGGKKKGKH